MENKDFAVFILTHGRPDNVKTLNTLKKCGYTGKIYYIVDNEDKTIDKYVQNFGVENVKVFDKKAMLNKIDRADNMNKFNLVLFARNKCFEIARELISHILLYWMMIIQLLILGLMTLLMAAAD